MTLLAKTPSTDAIAPVNVRPVVAALGPIEDVILVGEGRSVPAMVTVAQSGRLYWAEVQPHEDLEPGRYILRARLSAKSWETRFTVSDGVDVEPPPAFHPRRAKVWHNAGRWNRGFNVIFEGRIEEPDSLVFAYSDGVLENVTPALPETRVELGSGWVCRPDVSPVFRGKDYTFVVRDAAGNESVQVRVTAPRRWPWWVPAKESRPPAL